MTGLANLFLAHKDIQTQLDSQLIRTALRMDAFFSDNTYRRDLKKRKRNQHNKNRILGKLILGALTGLPASNQFFKKLKLHN